MDCSHTLSRWQPQVRVAYDYYPFGLTWHNPAAADTPEGRHDHAYQDKEFQWNEFGAGAGMALYDFHARMYDPATATWSVPDPAEQFSNPYLAMGNNPMVGVDPDGRFVQFIIGGTLGAIAGAQYANSVGATGLKKLGYVIGGAVVGGLSAGIGVAVASSGVVAANTLAILFASTTNTVGMAALTQGNVSSNVSFGPVSISSDGEIGYLGKKGNSMLENIGYGFGTLASISDILAGLNPGEVQLNTEKSDLIGHSSLTKVGETNPHDSYVSVGPDPGGPWIFNPFKFKKGTNDWKNYVDAGSDVWKVTVKGVNVKRIMDYGARLDQGVNYNLYFSSCVNHTARALTLAGAPTIGIHPFILHAQMFARSVGIRPMLFSYELYNL